MVEETSTAPADFPSRRKWGESVTSARNGGFQIVPNLLLRKQDQLGLSPQELVVLLNITMHWWEPENWPHPRANAIAVRMGISPRSVERHIERLQLLGLVEWLPRESGEGPSVRRFSLRGLIEKLEAIAEQEPDQTSVSSRAPAVPPQATAVPPQATAVAAERAAFDYAEDFI
jgi:hypothetical protein